ncbi:MAG: DUF4159 domain-containing protein [Bacteroidetes bacterium]|nr:DUF4159 domain-containing protein [Bacteroidota bacterium]MBP7399345.1 DUF4159 domain-containing protein [Chitinophagales bacterium]MBK8681961.1 DUF4159 domain-containing protein [Bacteroidota bacterium]MBP9188808.1 DUF4159 domain-containing protein [Chitinophagales bacterium]MBP9547798.1 DUF4159 domain-containing protein [Chitinophagales bacterium]
MKKYFLSVCLLWFMVNQIQAQASALSIALLKYNGGGDWYANPTSLPNLVSFCNQNLNVHINPEPATVEVGSPEIFNYPFVHMTGHGNVIFSNDEAVNLRNYLISGGFLHIDDNYGMDPYIKPAMQKVFPELEFIELPFDHAIFRQKFEFKNGLPKIHEHDGGPAQAFGLFWEGRLVCLYTYECDLGDGWEDQEVHNDPDAIRLKALQMGANIIQYVFMSI